MKRLVTSLAVAGASLAFTPVFGAPLNDTELDGVVGGTMKKGGVEFVSQKGINNANHSNGNVQQAGLANFNKSFNDNDVLSHNKVASGNEVNVLSKNKGNATSVQVGLLGKNMAYTKAKY